MAWTMDARIPVIVTGDLAGAEAALSAGGPAALLAETPAPPRPARAVALAAFGPGTPHPPGCACCAGRSPVATALDRLFQERVRGRCAWFERVVALAPTEEGRQALAAALDRDAVTAARFRAGPTPSGS